jgi:ribulose-phosphate 3-epimerase
MSATPRGRILLAPSILAADAGRLAEEVARVTEAGADWIHIDVMDGVFVPNLSIGPHVIRALRKHSKLPFDVHLMIEQPERSFERYVDAGADQVTVHAEATVHLHRTLTAIRERGVKAGVALNPSTPLTSLAYVLELVDVVLIMSVNPGFGGQRFLPAVLPKMRGLRTLAQAKGWPLLVSVDGGVDAHLAPDLAAAGAQVLVAGSAVFGSPDYVSTLSALRAAADSQEFVATSAPELV